ncbi:MAG: dethiobiotin synthase [Pseudomonadota bacterium]
MPAFFITGTDTGIGKTLFSAALLHALNDLGYTAVGMKPVAAGAEQGPAGWVNEDVALLGSASSVSAPGEWVNPYLFREAIAPHLAAGHKGVAIEIPRIAAALDELRKLAQVVVVEGVGGFRVPLGPDRDTADLAVRLGLPVIMVVGMRLGCLNHALLTAEAIAARGLTLAGWVANHLDPDMAAYDGNLATLQRSLPAPLIAEFPHQTKPDPARLAHYLAAVRLRALPGLDT